MSSDHEGETRTDGAAGTRKVFVVKSVGDGDLTANVRSFCLGGDEETEIDIDELRERVAAGDLEGLEDCDLEITEDHHVMVHGSGGGGGHPIVIKGHTSGHGNVVRYRCEETGSELIVRKDDAIEDVYVDPATGCLLERVEESEVRVMKIITRIETDDDDDHD